MEVVVTLATLIARIVFYNTKQTTKRISMIKGSLRQTEPKP
jgi:hypothetical protein